MKKFLQTILLAVISALLVATLWGCSESKKYKIGVSQCSQDDWREKMNDEIEREIMFHEEAEVEIRSADDSNEKQIRDIRYFADNNFDIIIVSPNEAAALTPVIKEIYEKGIPVIIFDRNIIGDSYTARIGVNDRFVAGRRAPQRIYRGIRLGWRASGGDRNRQLEQGRRHAGCRLSASGAFRHRPYLRP